MRKLSLKQASSYRLQNSVLGQHWGVGDKIFLKNKLNQRMNSILCRPFVSTRTYSNLFITDRLVQQASYFKVQFNHKMGKSNDWKLVKIFCQRFLFIFEVGNTKRNWIRISCVFGNCASFTNETWLSLNALSTYFHCITWKCVSFRTAEISS